MRIFRLLASHPIFLFKLNKSGFDECYQSAIKWEFEKSKSQLLGTLDDFVAKGLKNNLLSEHPLFGKMTQQDWGFMEYKHLHHHVKQFGV